MPMSTFISRSRSHPSVPNDLAAPSGRTASSSLPSSGSGEAMKHPTQPLALLAMRYQITVCTDLSTSELCAMSSPAVSRRTFVSHITTLASMVLQNIVK